MNRIQAVMLWAIVGLFAVLPLTALAQNPDVVVTITESDDPVYAGIGVPGNLTYDVDVINAGDGDATDLEVTVTLTLPGGVTVESVTNFNGTVSGTNPYTFSIPELEAAGGIDSSSLEIELTVSGAAGAATDSITIEAHVSALDETDSDTNNDFANEATSITTIATFQVSKDFSDDSTAGVAVQLTCSGGEVLGPLPIVTEGPISGLVVVDFPAGTSCAVTETVPAGYTASYDVGCTLDLIESTGGNYPCLITNTQLPVQFVVNKTFTDGNAADVTVDLVCDAGTVTADDSTASGSDPAEFTISNIPAAGTTCTATETLPAGYAQQSSTCTDVAVAVAGAPSCEFVNVPLRATFAVTKEFTDGDNPTEVEVSISCNTGLILDQSKIIDENEGVEFVVTDFDNGELNCEITEEGLLGYTPTYQPDGPGPFDAEGGCNFDDVEGGAANTCHIVNVADFVDVEIEKVWVVEGSGGDLVDTSYELTLYCDAQIEGGQQLCSNGGYDKSMGSSDYQTCKSFYGDGSEVFIAAVQPEYPSSQCWVFESVDDSGIEVDNGCLDLTVSPGVGDACTITNTVFFEGIPTVNQYGKMLIILLVLGVGLLAYRRTV